MDLIKGRVEKLKEEGARIRREIRERVVGYIAAALGLVAGLAWNEAIKALIEYLFPLGQDTLFAKFLYAVLITIIVVAVTVYLLRLVKKPETHEESRQSASKR